MSRIRIEICAGEFLLLPEVFPAFLCCPKPAPRSVCHIIRYGPILYEQPAPFYARCVHVYMHVSL